MFGSKRANIQDYSTAEEDVCVYVYVFACVCMCLRLFARVCVCVCLFACVCVDMCVMEVPGQEEMGGGGISKLQDLYNKES